jgi:hypothetical protein
MRKYGCNRHSGGKNLVNTGVDKKPAVRVCSNTEEMILIFPWYRSRREGTDVSDGLRSTDSNGG